jgi:beta-lactamase superfamily II metal-dependent hydrolase
LPDHYRLKIPRLSPGEYPIVLDGEATSAVLTVYAGHLAVRFIDVGQGDATLIQTPDGTVILVDGGPLDSTPAIHAALAERGINRIDRVVVTHTDADHLGGLAALSAGADTVPGTADDIRIEEWLDEGGLDGCGSAACAAYRSAAGGRRAITAADDLHLPGDTHLELLASAGTVVGFGAIGATGERPAAADDDNARSVVLMLRQGAARILLTGDITGGGLGTPDVEAALSPRLGGSVDVLKVAHHGSRSSTSSTFAAAARPRLSIVSAGTDNSHCHPTAEVLTRLAATGDIYSTGRGIPSATGRCASTRWPESASSGCGTVALDTHRGETLRVRCAGREKVY